MAEWNVSECDWCKKTVKEFCPKGWVEIKEARTYGPWFRIKKKLFCAPECMREFVISVFNMTKDESGPEPII